MRIRSKFENDWNFLILFHHEENTCKSSLHSNLFILADFHSFTVKEKNSKISQFSSCQLRSVYAILVKIWKWLKLLNSFLIIKETLVNHLYIWIWSFWLTCTALQWMKINFKISQFEDFCLGPGMRFWAKTESVLNFLILFHSSRKLLSIMFACEFDHLDWLSQFYSEWRQTSKLLNFQDFC